jgi:predicted Fe-Mo cluster-binding NifX family protein
MNTETIITFCDDVANLKAVDVLVNDVSFTVDIENLFPKSRNKLRVPVVLTKGESDIIDLILDDESVFGTLKKDGLLSSKWVDTSSGSKRVKVLHITENNADLISNAAWAFKEQCVDRGARTIAGRIASKVLDAFQDKYVRDHIAANNRVKDLKERIEQGVKSGPTVVKWETKNDCFAGRIYYADETERWQSIGTSQEVRFVPAIINGELSGKFRVGPWYDSDVIFTSLDEAKAEAERRLSEEVKAVQERDAKNILEAVAKLAAYDAVVRERNAAKYDKLAGIEGLLAAVSS